MNDNTDSSSEEFTDESSLESDETVITEQPLQTDPAVPNENENLHFVGYEPPKPKAWKTFIKSHKVMLSLASIFGMVVVTSGMMFIASSRAKEARIVEQSQIVAQSSTAPSKTAEQVDADAKPLIGSSAYSLMQNEKMYKMVSDGEIWLERAESEWINYKVWNGWLFFLSNKTPSGTDPGAGITKIGIDAFNFKTKQYVELGDITPPSQAGLKEPITEQEGQLYISIHSGSGMGATYRCTLDAEKACSSPELFYDGAGSVHIVDDQSAFVLDQSNDDSKILKALKSLSMNTKQAIQIYSASSEGGAVEQFGAYSNDGYAWIVRTIKDAQEGSGMSVERLSAINIAGEQKFVLTPESFPIIDAKLTVDPERKAHEITFANSDQEVVFDVNKKEFGPIAKRSTSADQNDVSSAIEQAITLPSLYSIKEVL